MVCLFHREYGSRRPELCPELQETVSKPMELSLLNELAQDPTPHRAPRPALPEDMSRERPFASDLSFPCPSTFLPNSRGCPRSPAA